jgi:hypothetical protein
MTTKKRTRKKTTLAQCPIPLKIKPEPRRAVFYGRVARVDEPVDVNNKSNSTPIVSGCIHRKKATNNKGFSHDGYREIIDGYKDVHNNATQPTAVTFLRARALGLNGPDHEREQQMIAWQRAACEQAAQQLGAQVIREYVEYGGTGRIDTRFVVRLMLNELYRRHDTTYLIVDKAERLGKPMTQAMISLKIQAAGAELIIADTQADSEINNKPLSQLKGLIAMGVDPHSGNKAQQRPTRRRISRRRTRSMDLLAQHVSKAARGREF